MAFTLPQLLRGWRAALLLVAVALCSPEKASAACGDYITYGNSHANGHGKPMADADHANSPSPVKTPCQGPNCSGGPVREFPPVPPAPVTYPTKEQVRQLTPPETSDDSLTRFFDRDSTSARPIDRTDSIFHPPRLG